MTAQNTAVRPASHSRRRAGELASKILVIVLMTLVTVLVLYPLLFVVSTSFKDYMQFVNDPFSIKFTHPENYVTAWERGNFGPYFINSIIVAVCAVCGQVFFTALIGFAGCIPELITEAWRAVKAGDFAETRRLQEKIFPMAECIYGIGQPSGEAHANMKEALYQRGKFTSPLMREPVLPLKKEAKARITEALKLAGLKE